jgi:hypothetical protein
MNISIITGIKLWAKFELTFCLGEKTGTFVAGFNKLTPAGIEGNVPCPGSKENCPQPITQNSESGITLFNSNLVKSIDFGAEMKIELNSDKFNEKKDIKIPDNSFDVLNIFNTSTEATSTKPQI